jgi:hypothetical protein
MRRLGGVNVVFLTQLLLITTTTSSSAWSPASTNGRWVDRNLKFSLENNADDVNSASVGDYVKGVHGGKYQFSAAGINAEGQDFAASGYASSPVEDEDMMRSDHKLPRWAQRLGTNVQELEQRALLLGIFPPTSVTIQNQERTWEPFYVKIMRVVDGTSAVDILSSGGPFRTAPTRGKLAPLGGAHNPYKPQDPYRDAETIQISVDDGYAGDSSSYFLVIGTEEEQWVFRILSQ